MAGCPRPGGGAAAAVKLNDSQLPLGARPRRPAPRIASVAVSRLGGAAQTMMEEGRTVTGLGQAAGKLQLRAKNAENVHGFAFYTLICDLSPEPITMAAAPAFGDLGRTAKGRIACDGHHPRGTFARVAVGPAETPGNATHLTVPPPHWFRRCALRRQGRPLPVQQRRFYQHQDR